MVIIGVSSDDLDGVDRGRLTHGSPAITPRIVLCVVGLLVWCSRQVTYFSISDRARSKQAARSCSPFV